MNYFLNDLNTSKDILSNSGVIVLDILLSWLYLQIRKNFLTYNLLSPYSDDYNKTNETALKKNDYKRYKWCKHFDVNIKENAHKMQCMP